MILSIIAMKNLHVQIVITLLGISISENVIILLDNREVLLYVTEIRLKLFNVILNFLFLEVHYISAHFIYYETQNMTKYVSYKNWRKTNQKMDAAFS